MSLSKRVVRFVFWLVVGVLIAIAYLFSIQVTQPNLYKLVTSAPKAKQILGQFLTPDVASRASESTTISVAFPIPCGSAEAPPVPTTGPRMIPEPGCAAEREKFTLNGFDFPPNAEITLRWRLPDGGALTFKRLTSDASGNFQVEGEARPIVAAKDGKPAQIETEVTLPVGSLKPSQATKDVVNAMFVTIFMALLATTLGTIIAAPLSFLAASNITRHGPVGTTVYHLSRSVLNVVRSFEALVMATIYALIVGFGSPFAGVLALTVVTTASLGKMFSESVESIDPGPIEAVTATGANRGQTVLYAVVPQIIPDFMSFIIYHWDINVRISTVIGFVGGGGIGYLLFQYINSFEYHKAGTALLAIVIVVWVLDFLSAEVRKQLT